MGAQVYQELGCVPLVDDARNEGSKALAERCLGRLNMFVACFLLAFGLLPKPPPPRRAATAARR